MFLRPHDFLLSSESIALAMASASLKEKDKQIGIDFGPWTWRAIRPVLEERKTSIARGSNHSPLFAVCAKA